jgi:predicted RNase H-like nuclease
MAEAAGGSSGSAAAALADGSTVLGIDAAWTEGQPSGVALVQLQSGRWRCLAIAPSYRTFEDLAAGIPLDWGKRPRGSKPSMARLLAAAQKLAGSAVELLAVDMPLATEAINGRREADREVSSVFGSRGCSVHSPGRDRPGRLADHIRSELQVLGYELQTATIHHRGPGVMEVYPHVALLALLQRHYRLPYKVSRSLQYAKGEALSRQERIRRLLVEFRRIDAALQRQIDGMALPLPDAEQVTALAALKPWEDCLDALICAWVGIEHLRGRTRGLGDSSAAIWCPDAAFCTAGAEEQERS